MNKLAVVLAVLFCTSLAVAETASGPAHDQISTWVLIKLTDAGCTVRADPTAMNGMQGRLRESLSAEQYASITDQTLYLATDCNTRQALAEAALLEQANGSPMRLDPLRLNQTTAVYNVTGATEGVAALLALTPLGEKSGVAVITMAAGPTR